MTKSTIKSIPTPTQKAIRTAATAACEAWLATTHARCLVEVPIAQAKFQQAMANRLRDAFAAGFAAGVNSGTGTGSP